MGYVLFDYLGSTIQAKCEMTLAHHKTNCELLKLDASC